MAAQNFALGSQILAEDAQIGDLTSEGADGLDSSTDIVLGDLNPVFKIRDTSFAIEISLGLELVISLLLWDQVWADLCEEGRDVLQWGLVFHL